VSDFHLFPVLYQNLGGYKFKDDSEVEMVETDDMGPINKEKEICHNTIYASAMAELCGKVVG
jgi:hypothetical protein